MKNNNNDNKTLVISGGTRGIGKTIAYRFAQEGTNIAFTYNSNEQLALEMVEDLTKQYGIKAKCYPLDILQPQEYQTLFGKIDEDFDQIDYFVSNAIISGRSVVGGFAPFMRLKPKGLNNIYTATVLSFVVGAQEAARRMQKNDEGKGRGVIISLSSTGNRVYTPNYAGHGNSKSAVETMVKYAAQDLGEYNIRVNAVSGGPIDTDALKKFPNYEEVKAEVIKRSPLSKMGEAEDICGFVKFLCSDEARWCTGETIVVDGGTSFK